MSKKMKKLKNKRYKMEKIQLFDWLEMPHLIDEKETTILIAGWEGAGNDTYHRWYPSEVNEEIGKYCKFKNEAEQKAGQKLNQWLLEHGMVEDTNDKYFHVLIHISW